MLPLSGFQSGHQRPCEHHLSQLRKQATPIIPSRSILRLRKLCDLPQVLWRVYSGLEHKPNQGESPSHCSPEASICDFSLDRSATLGTQIPFTSASLSSSTPPIFSIFYSVCPCGVLNEIGPKNYWRSIKRYGLVRRVVSLGVGFSQCVLSASCFQIQM